MCDLGITDELTLSLLATTCRLLITSANSLDPDQDRQNICPDLYPKGLISDNVPERIYRKS